MLQGFALELEVLALAHELLALAITLLALAQQGLPGVLGLLENLVPAHAGALSVAASAGIATGARSLASSSLSRAWACFQAPGKPGSA